MFGSFLLYAAALAAVVGAVAMFRHPRAGAAIAGTSILVIAIVLVWPVTTKRTGDTATHLDQSMPVWQFGERHTIHVDAPPARVFAAIHAVPAKEILFFRTLTGIRRGFRPSPPSIINAPESEPLLDVATRTSFRYVADDTPREIVVGTRFGPDITAMMNFLITPDAGGCTLSTETRVFARNRPAVRMFSVYWRAILPGSDILRRSWLRAIKRRAEA